MEGDVIQQSDQKKHNQQTVKRKKLELDEDENTRFERMIHRKSTPYKINGQLREDIAAEVRKNELSMSAISTKFDVNKHAVLRIRKQELGR